MTSVRNLKARVAQAVENDKELALSPEFFLALPLHIPRIGSVEILLKRGNSSNELTRYRYDVVLRVECNEARYCQSELIWSDDELSLAKLRNFLVSEQPGEVWIRGIRNRRLWRDLELLRSINEAPEYASIKEVEASCDQNGLIDDIDPEGFCTLCEEAGYDVRLCWTIGSVEGRFDALLTTTCHRHADRPVMALRPSASANDKSLSVYANNPSLPLLRRSLEAAVRADLKSRLPSFMLPAAIIAIPSLPLTQNGKLDRGALLSRGIEPFERAAYQAPKTEEERVVAGLIGELFGIDRVGRADNFFELGGHSLLATQLIARMRQSFGVEIPVRTVFDFPVVADLGTQVTKVIQQSSITYDAILNEPIPSTYDALLGPE